jgi:intracellular sulfur oxidation DsrE/DsrF family protein
VTRLARLAIAILLVLAGSLSQSAWSGDKRASAKPMRVVIQVNEDDAKKWHGILANVRNIQRDVGPGNVAIAVVAIGPGLDMLMADSLAANDVQDAIAAGVEFIACENTMHARKIDRSDLLEGIGYAKAGYVEIVRRQQRGWSYLRP